MRNGNLYLIPTLLADETVETVLPQGTLGIIRTLDHFIVEELRTARRFLIKATITKRIDDLTFMVFNEHTAGTDPREFLAPAIEGHDIGLLSEAGAPCVADPGSKIVAKAHELGIRVIPLTGPSSILLAVMASGLNGQNFAFVGYLPADKFLRVKKLKELEKTITEKDQTQIFIETPYRNVQLFETIVASCSPAMSLCIATDVCGISETIRTLPVSEWRTHKPDIHKRPTIFLLYR
jgi:16S rRNA (cytidine1402-2'-O)-methyltransferase